MSTVPTSDTPTRSSVGPAPDTPTRASAGPASGAPTTPAARHTPTERSWHMTVPHHAQGARTARHRLRVELADAVPAALLADTMTVAAELLGNAVRHAAPLPGGTVRLSWRLRDDPTGHLVEIRVTDGGAGVAPRIRQVGPDSADGRGLFLVAALATDWGVARDGLGQSVWARLQHPVGCTPEVRGA